MRMSNGVAFDSLQFTVQRMKLGSRISNKLHWEYDKACVTHVTKQMTRPILHSAGLRNTQPIVAPARSYQALPRLHRLGISFGKKMINDQDKVKG